MIKLHEHSPALRILAGSGRSGTTWLLDVLCEANNLHPIFEPLHPEGWKRASQFSRRYAHDSNADMQSLNLNALEKFWQQLLTNDYPPTWIDYRVRPDRLVPGVSDISSLTSFKRFVAHWRRWLKHRSVYSRSGNAASLVKVIRANLLLPVLARREHTHWTLVLRHPAAVVESQLRLRGDWAAHRIANRYSNDEALARRLGCSWSDWVKQMNSDAELFTLIWCLENLLPLEDIAGAHKRVLFYERLANYDSDEWSRLLEGLGLEHMPGAAALKFPSQQSTQVMGKSASLQTASVLDRLKPEDRDGIQRVLDLFEVTFYHTVSLEPVVDQLLNSRPWNPNYKAALEA